MSNKVNVNNPKNENFEIYERNTCVLLFVVRYIQIERQFRKGYSLFLSKVKDMKIHVKDIETTEKLKCVFSNSLIIMLFGSRTTYWILLLLVPLFCLWNLGYKFLRIGVNYLLKYLTFEFSMSNSKTSKS
jgi:hypothetical protein